ncbi:MAG TPA: LLM class flavin-dependent oxidoreductase [Pseudonocardiaceae bacterium]
MHRLGVWTPQFDRQPIDAVRSAARELDDLGYAALWFGETFGRDALTTAALLLPATDRLVIGTGVASVYARGPVATAQAQRTLNEAYGDRFVLGLGITHPWLANELHGREFGPRVPTMRSYVDSMDAAKVGPPGATKPGPRVFGAVGRRMLALAAELGAGALPLGMPVEHTRRTRAILGPDAFIGVIVPVLVAPDNEASRQIALDYVAESLPNRADLLAGLGYPTDLSGPGALDLAGALVAWGDRDAIAARLTEHLEAGADQVCVYVIGTQDGELPLAQWRDLSGLVA